MTYPIPRDIERALAAEHSNLAQIVDNAVLVSFNRAALECRGEDGEVDKVLSFFLHGLELIETEFNRVLIPRGIEVSIAGVFTHQTPMVEFPHSNPQHRCELADVCILASYNEPLGPDGGLGNSILLQAKNDFDEDASADQRELYEQAAHFDYYRPAALVNAAPAPPSTRDLPPKLLPGLAYWELRNGWWQIPHGNWHQTSALLWASHIIYGSSRRYAFGSSVVDFLSGAAGYGFRRPASRERDWNRIMFDLLTVTATALVTRQKLNVRGGSRQIGSVIRELLVRYGTGGPAVLLNSLPKILGFYASDLGKLAAKAAQGALTPEELRRSAKLDGGGEKPPFLGDNREARGDENGGAGNLILFHFSRHNKK